MSADSALRGVFDRFARMRQLSKEAWAGGTDFWARVDGAGDEVFENIVKGQTTTDLDTMFVNAAFGDQSQVGAFLQLITSYFQNATDSATPGLGYSSAPWNSYLNAKRFGVPYEFAELYYDRYRTRLDAQFVTPKGTADIVDLDDIADNATAGLHKIATMTNTTGTWTLAADSGVIPTTMKGAPIVLYSDAGCDSAVTVTLTLMLQNRTTSKTVTITANDFAADTGVIVGAQALGGNADAGQKDVLVAATGQFAADEWVAIIDDSAGFEEICQIDSITTNTKLVMKDNLVNNWTTANTAIVVPLFTNWTAIGTASGGGNGDIIAGYAMPLRLIAL